ncbi:MAG: 3-deoxy-D-manno-octulosonic acid transferase, partial [Nitratireductor sp.]
EAFPAFEEAGAMLRVANAASLAAAAARLLASESERRRMGAAAQRIASGDSGATGRTLDALLALLPAPEARSANHA